MKRASCSQLLMAITSDLVHGSKGSRSKDTEFLEFCLLEDTHLGLVGCGSTRCQRLHQLIMQDRCDRTKAGACEQ